jgi:hypothetical protein
VLTSDLNTVRLDVAPRNLWVVQLYAASECSADPIAFGRRESIGQQHVQRPCEEGIILRDLRFDYLEPRFHLDGRQDVRLFERERSSGILAAPENPVELAPLLEVFRADVASRGNTVAGCTFQFVVAAVFVKRVWSGPVLVGLFQIE